MDLAEQIAQITDNLAFTKLCNAVFTARYPADFQIIDGTRADQGNDGYITSESMMLAYHCPTKPEQRTDKKYLDKIQEDLGKAHQLHAKDQYAVRKWAFVTPRPLSNGVVSQMRKEAEAIGIMAISLDATFLADVLSRNRELLHQFPYLQIPNIEERLGEIVALLRTGKIPSGEPGAKSQDIGKPESASDDFRQVVEIRMAEQTAESKGQLRSLFYKTTDPYAQANAVLGLLQWFDPSEDRVEEMLAWCDRGISIVQRLGDRGHEAYFRAHKGYFLSSMYTMEDMQMFFSIRADHMIGIQTVTEADRQSVITRLRTLENSFTDEFNTALKIMSEVGNLELWGEILLPIGNAAGQRAFHFATTGLTVQAQSEKQIAINALLAAKDAFAKCGNELSVGYAIFAMAKQLRFLGEPKEALDLVKTANGIAEKHKDFRLGQGARLLKTTIESGRVPDYVHGERRERKK